VFSLTSALAAAFVERPDELELSRMSQEHRVPPRNESASSAPLELGGDINRSAGRINSHDVSPSGLSHAERKKREKIQNLTTAMMERRLHDLLTREFARFRFGTALGGIRREALDTIKSVDLELSSMHVVPHAVSQPQKRKKASHQVSSKGAFDGLSLREMPGIEDSSFEDDDDVHSERHWPSASEMHSNRESIRPARIDIGATQENPRVQDLLGRRSKAQRIIELLANTTVMVRQKLRAEVQQALLH